MMFIDENSSREQLLAAIDAESDLFNYYFYYERSFIVSMMTTEEIYDVIVEWIEAGNEVES